MAEKPIGPGTVLAGRFRLEDLLHENSGAKFWRASDLTLARNVAVHVVGADDPRSGALLAAARASATVADGHILRVLDAAQEQGAAFVVNEWGSGMSLDRMLADGPLSPRRAAWVVKEVADALTTAHRSGVAHGRLVPENVMVSEAGAVKLIGFVVDGVLNGRGNGAGATDRGFGDLRADVTNLASVLYAALVGKWPGTEHSSVPPAPCEHGHPLRPRQVRAGIPRPLDAICDQVLHPDQPHRNLVPIETAHEVCAALADFLGDPGAANVGDHEHTMVLGPVQRSAEEPSSRVQPVDEPTARVPPVEEPTMRVAPVDEPTAQALPVEEPTAPQQEPAPTDDPEATQAGSPVFSDEGGTVGWLTSAESFGQGDGERRPAPPPPPPLPEPEPKPLFAPDPPGGWRRRTWEDTPDAHRRADPGPVTTGGPGTGSLPPVWGPDAHQPPPDDDGWDEAQKAGRGWLRLGAVIVGALLLIFAVVIAFNLGRGGPGGASSGQPSASGSARSSNHPGQVLSIVGVRDFDPEGNPPEENPQMAPLAVDGDPTTAWQTMTYYGNPKLGGLKSGVGLIVDLGQQHHVARVDLTLVGQPTSLELYSAGSSDTAPTSLKGLNKVATAKNAGTHVVLKLAHPVTTEYLVVWLTSLPPAPGGYQGKIAEVQVRS